MQNKKYRPRKGIAYREIQGEVVLADPVNNRVLRINETGSFIWGHLENNTLSAIVEEMTVHFDVSKEIAEQDINHFTSLLLDRQLIEPVDV